MSNTTEPGLTEQSDMGMVVFMFQGGNTFGARYLGKSYQCAAPPYSISGMRIFNDTPWKS